VVNQCLDCHRKEKEARLSAPTLHFADDVHAHQGFTCVACHGGDASDPDITGMDPDKGYIGKPKKVQIAEVCAKCHADAAFMKRYNPQPYIFSIAEFRTSVHCKKIAEGDTKVATCTDCHGVHGILRHTDPASPVYHTNVPATCAHCHNPDYMQGRKIPTNQYTLWKGSVHGRALLKKEDLSAPACNNCHGNHGAVPPNTRDISRVCGNCHGREGELFEASKVKEQLELEGKRGCVTCHSNHDVQAPTDAMIGLRGEGVCGRCHDKGSLGEQAAARIVPAFQDLKHRMAAAESLLAYVDELGMPTAGPRELLKQTNDQVVAARATMHSFNYKQIMTVLDEGRGYADKAVAGGNSALKDWHQRRVGMGLSLAAILFAIMLLVLKIRQLEAPPRSDP
jgi:predicted CXXCH cytochrome family protein